MNCGGGTSDMGWRQRVSAAGRGLRWWWRVCSSDGTRESSTPGTVVSGVLDRRYYFCDCLHMGGDKFSSSVAAVVGDRGIFFLTQSRMRSAVLSLYGSDREISGH